MIADLALDGGVSANAGAPGNAGSGAGSNGGAGEGGRNDGGAGASAAGSGELAAWCSGRGGLSLIRGDGQNELACAGGLAARSFGLALCACGSAIGPGSISTASSLPDGSLQNRGAAVGMNGAGMPLSAAPGAVPAASSSLPGFASLGGDLVLAGQSALQLAPGAQRVMGDLLSRAPIASGPGQSSLRVDGDAWLPAVSPLDPSALVVGGELVLSPEGESAADSQRWSAARATGGVRRADTSLSPPCACDAQQSPDVQATVAWAATHNDNAQLGFAPERLSSVAEPTTLALPCGRYHFPTIDGPGELRLRIDQPVALFVGDLLGVIAIELGPQGSLDLFVSGSFQPRGGRLGDPLRPSATRVYVHDQPMPGPLAMLGELVSNFYGPTVGVQAFGVLRRGSMVVRDLIVNDSLRV
ncbi:MAG TPA: hypothetical protein VK509_08215, partial [Polyangiales bacterium]|nr:hypothetical protein [Polyangiales bacterium]